MPISFTLLLTGIITFLIPAKVMALDSCGSGTRTVGYETTQVDGGIEIIATKRVEVNSDLKEDFIKSIFEAESLARIDLLRFINSKCTQPKFSDAICFHPDKISDSPKLDKQLKMMVTTSKCNHLNRYVVVSVELSPRTIKLAE
tara:strand:+ start:443 stop:874 length:432 start_codon:yes stop_codon:yes gene_type:complete